MAKKTWTEADLPTWQAIHDKSKTTVPPIKLTALEEHIYLNEPSGKRDIVFRMSLLKLLEEISG